MQFLFSPFWGRLSDKWGRRPIILISVLFSALGHLIFGLSSTIAMVFAARLLAGFGNANLGTAQAIISDSTTKENRAKGMGLIGAAFGLGFLFGPAIGGFAGQFSPQAPALVASGLAVINFVIAYFFLPETRKVGSSDLKNLHRKIFSLSAFKKAITVPNLAIIFCISFINTAAFAMFEVVVGLLMERAYLPSEDRGSHIHIAEAASLTAWFLVTVGVTAVIVQGGLIGTLSRKFGEVKLVRFGLLATAMSITLMPVFSSQFSYTAMLGLAGLLAVGTGLFNPSQSSLISKTAPEDEQGEILGVNQSMSALGRVVGPTLSGFLFEYHIGAPFFLAGTLGGIAFLLALNLKADKES
jgi:MFS family permease